jgi:hypothetical protein
MPYAPMESATMMSRRRIASAHRKRRTACGRFAVQRCRGYSDCLQLCSSNKKAMGLTFR